MSEFAYYNYKQYIFCIEYEENFILSIKFSDKVGEGSKTSTLSDFVFNQLQEYMLGKRREFTFLYKLVGTDFQLKVWNALKNIPYGEVRSYKDIAREIGNPKAYRAVGMANNKNPIIIAVPCHRVIGSDGNLVGYVGGMDMKKYLLNLENPSFDISNENDY